MLRLIAIATLVAVSATTTLHEQPQDPRAWDAAPWPPLACTRVSRVMDEAGPRPTINEPGRPRPRRPRPERAPRPNETLDPTPGTPRPRDEAVNPGDVAGVELPREPRQEKRVTSPAELVATITDESFKGTIIIPADANWDMTGYWDIDTHSGINIVGERGPLCSRPRLYTNKRDSSFAFFQVRSSDEVRIEGLHLVGPQGSSRSLTDYSATVGIRVWVTRNAVPIGQRIMIRDNEMEGWPNAAVNVLSTIKASSVDAWPAEVDTAVPRATAGMIRIDNNHLHNNSMNSHGYGAGIGTGAYATLIGNVFDANRHAVASNGFAYSGYIAKFNYILEGGYTESGYWNQHFDVHGTGSGGYGGIAGEYFEIAHNTIRGDQGYAVLYTRPAFMLRAAPTIGAWLHDNVLVHEDLDDAVDLSDGELGSNIGEDHDAYHFKASGNHFGTDYYDQFTTGDFDGDGRTDLLLTNGTAWMVSRGGREPWQFLHASDKRIGELGVADINNDGVSDVVWRAPDGRLGYLAFGAGEPIWIGTSPVPANELRFGDFDGDGKTDIFRRGARGEWIIMYRATGTWDTVGSSGLELKNLLFGDFDTKEGTDIAGALAGYWGISSGAVTLWDTLGRRQRSTFANALVGDFDANGTDDIAFPEVELVGAPNSLRMITRWKYSPDGHGTLKKLGKEMTLPARTRLHLRVGEFEGGRQSQLITWANTAADKWNYLVLWNGDPDRGLATYSRTAMK